MSRLVCLVLLSLLVVVQCVSTVAVASPFASVYPLTLADPAIATDGPVISLDDSTWSASAPSLGLDIAGNVPGDLITDLFLAGVIPEPLYELNWLNASIWNDNVWYYNHSVSLSAMQYSMLGNASDGFDLLLTFDGIKMGADILMNDVKIGQALAQFGRLVFSLKSIMHNKTLAGAIKQGDNTLSVVFDPMIITPLFMQCTGGWDWSEQQSGHTASSAAQPLPMAHLLSLLLCSGLRTPTQRRLTAVSRRSAAASGRASTSPPYTPSPSPL